MPRIPQWIDHERLLGDAAAFLGLPLSDVERTFRVYQRFHDAKGYARTLGEQKTLTFEEAFLLGMVMSLTRPPVIVELGTQHGKSTRRIVDLAGLLGLSSRVICYDVVDALTHVSHEEVEFHQEDLTGRLRTEILDRHGEGLIFLDAHAYGLTKEAIAETRDHYGNWTLAIHDCGRGLCNPHMTLGQDDPAISSLTGVWERHVLAEVFGIDDPMSERLDEIDTATHRLKIFDTQHGLAILVPAAVGPWCRNVEELVEVGSWG